MVGGRKRKPEVRQMEKRKGVSLAVKIEDCLDSEISDTWYST